MKPWVNAMIKTSPASRIQSNLQELFQANVSSGRPYVRFKVSVDHEALLSMKWVEESLVIDSEKVTPLPAMPSALIGMMNSRDHVFCLWDLANLLQIPSSIKNPQEYQVLVLKSSSQVTQDNNKILLGLAVSQIEGILRLEEAEIQSADNILTTLQKYVLGTITDKGGQNMILDPNLLIQEISKS